MSTSEKRKKTSLVMVRVAPEDHDVLRTRAAEAGLSVSGYLLASGLSRLTASKTNAHLIQELRQLGARQKELWIVGGGALTPEYRTVLVEILLLLGRIGI